MEITIRIRVLLAAKRRIFEGSQRRLPSSEFANPQRRVVGLRNFESSSPPPTFARGICGSDRPYRNMLALASLSIPDLGGHKARIEFHMRSLCAAVVILSLVIARSLHCRAAPSPT